MSGVVSTLAVGFLFFGSIHVSWEEWLEYIFFYNSCRKKSFGIKSEQECQANGPP
jgi:hypothetical protein